MSIEWRDSLATGNEEIDLQHKELFRRFNDLLTSCKEGKGKDEVVDLLFFLGDYVRTHFATEEELQVRHNYPGYPQHKEQHEGFIRDLRSLESQLNTDGVTLPLVIQTNQTMVGWLIKHISGTDKELANFLRSVG
jgi:hemerythrin